MVTANKLSLNEDTTKEWVSSLRNNLDDTNTIEMLVFYSRFQVVMQPVYGQCSYLAHQSDSFTVQIKSATNGRTSFPYLPLPF